MATTDRRRLEHAESELGAGGGEAREGGQLPTYTLVDEGLSVEEQERSQAQETEARARDAKGAAREEMAEGQ